MTVIREFLFSVDYGLIKALEFLENQEMWMRTELEKKAVGDDGEKAEANQVDIRVLLSSEYGDFKHMYPRLARQSLFLHVYGLAESALNELCDKIRATKGLALSYGHLAGKGVKRAGLYLDKVAEVRLPTLLTEKTEFEFINFVRNKLIHNDGVLNPDDRNGFKDKLKKAPSLRGISYNEETSRIGLEKEFLNATIARFRHMFQELGEILEESFTPFDERGKRRPTPLEAVGSLREKEDLAGSRTDPPYEEGKEQGR